MTLSASLPSVLTFSLISSVFWAVGLHGDNMIIGIVNPVLLALLAENVAAGGKIMGGIIQLLSIALAEKIG